MDNYDYFAGSSRPAAQPPALPPQPPAPSTGGLAPATLQPTAAGIAAATAPPASGTALSGEEQMMLQTSALESYAHMHATTSAVPVGMGLGFFGSIRTGFALLPICWRVLTRQISMLLVPFAVTVLGAVAFLAYAAAFGGVDSLVNGGDAASVLKLVPVVVLLGMIGAVGQAVVVADATDLLNGSRTSLGKAWATTANQLPRILLFGMLYAAERTVTALIRNGRRFSFFGDLIADIADRAWDFTTYLAIPVLLYEDVAALASVKRSGHLVAQRWGVQLTARSVFGFAIALLTFPLVLLGLVVAFDGHTALGVGLVVITLLATTVISNALTGVLSAALYRFAVTGVIAPGFRPGDMSAVFSRR